MEAAGGGAVLASFAAYTVEKKVSRKPETFGRGAIAGVAVLLSLAAMAAVRLAASVAVAVSVRCTSEVAADLEQAAVLGFDHFDRASGKLGIAVGHHHLGAGARQQDRCSAAIADAVASNPNLLTQIEQAKGEAELNKGKQLFAQATTKYLIWGTVALLIVVVAVVIYKKKFAK